VSFDLVISDYRMPGMDGVEFLTRMIGRQPNVARVILSGYTDLKSMIVAINDIQIFRYLTKPWYGELRWIVRQALSQRALLLENERLANTVRAQQRTLDQQQYELRRLEAECPGITHLQLSDDGRIMISEGDDAWDSADHDSWRHSTAT
jgi:DNA-binding NtrC family response regulator